MQISEKTVLTRGVNFKMKKIMGVLWLCAVSQTFANVPIAFRPNVIVLFVDDWGWGDLGANCLAAKEVPGANSIDKQTACSRAKRTTLTPNLDSLAHEGMRLTDFHATGVCTPSRSQIQTGRQGARTGVTTNFQPGSLGGLPQTERTIASYVKQQGYATWCVTTYYRSA